MYFHQIDDVEFIYDSHVFFLYNVDVQIELEMKTHKLVKGKIQILVKRARRQG